MEVKDRSEITYRIRNRSLMDVTLEAHLLKLYMHDYIDTRRPVTLDYQVKRFSEKGYIELGYTDDNFPSFETWKRIRIMFGHYLTSSDLSEEDIKFIIGSDSPIDIFGRAILHQAAKNLDKLILG